MGILFRSRSLNGFRPLILSFILLYLVGLPACGTTVPSGDNVTQSSYETPESLLQELVRRYEIRNTAGLLDLVHTQYKDIKGNRNDLQYRISQVTDQYGNIEVRLSEVRTRPDSLGVLDVRWDLLWRCRARGPGCYQGDETVERSGRTEFVFGKESGQWKLRNQRGSALFGNFQPGRVKR